MRDPRARQPEELIESLARVAASETLRGNQEEHMRMYKIAAMGGDGIGPEVVEAGVQVLKVCAERDGGFTLDVQDFKWGSDYHRKHGVMMPADGADQLRKFDAILFGAVGAPDIPDHITLWGLRLAICHCVTKSNAQRHAMVMWDEIAAEVAAEFPDVTWDKMLVDAMTMRMVMKPQTLDTIVATNLHADILSDLAAALAGSLGIAPTANINPERATPSMF